MTKWNFKIESTNTGGIESQGYFQCCVICVLVFTIVCLEIWWFCYFNINVYVGKYTSFPEIFSLFGQESRFLGDYVLFSHPGKDCYKSYWIYKYAVAPWKLQKLKKQSSFKTYKWTTLICSWTRTPLYIKRSDLLQIHKSLSTYRMFPIKIWSELRWSYL